MIENETTENVTSEKGK